MYIFIFFQINKLHLCKPLIRAIDSATIKDQFKLAHLVTYRYSKDCVGGMIALIFKMSGPGSGPAQGPSVVFLSKLFTFTLPLSHSIQEYKMSAQTVDCQGKLTNAKGKLQWTSIPSWRQSSTPTCFML